MSNVYIQEPPTNGKVQLTTSVGEIDIELWSKEAPLACRNFVQLCMEGYYDGTMFHRVIKDFLVQGGDPTGTGEGGESIYGRPFKTEVHSRLRFTRRGLVAMSCAARHENTSQFFFTLEATPELDKRHTIFGKVVGDTVFNMIKLEECEVDRENRPLDPQRILRTEVILNPFDDIVPRVVKSSVKHDTDESLKRESKSRATKAFNLLSFGDEAEEDEEEITEVQKELSAKPKSSHDLLDDPRLSKETVTITRTAPAVGTEGSSEEEGDGSESSELRSVREKLAPSATKRPNRTMPSSSANRGGEKADDNMDEDEPPAKKPPSRVEQLRQEAESLTRELRKGNRDSKLRDSTSTDASVSAKVEPPAVTEFRDSVQRYEELRGVTARLRRDAAAPADSVGEPAAAGSGSRGAGNSRLAERERATLALLARFNSRLESAVSGGRDGGGEGGKEEGSAAEGKEGEKAAESEEEEDGTDGWLGHKLECTDEADKPKKVLDANVYDPERYATDDPRNPINERKRKSRTKK